MESENTPARAVELGHGLRRITAPNPSPMTYTGTQTYLLGTRDCAVIDPGPKDEAHLQAILDAVPKGGAISHIFVTHSHIDHSPLAPILSQATGAPVFAAGPSDWGRSPVMEALAAKGDIGGGEGVDGAFRPDQTLHHAERLAGPWGEIDVLHTPGHMANHLSFAWNGALFSGDLVMGWSSSLISPPDGDMTAFFASLALLARRAKAGTDKIYYPGHGDPIEAPAPHLQELIAHRRKRESQIRDTLAEIGPASAAELAIQIYTDTPPTLRPAAARNVLAHLIDLHARGLVTSPTPLRADSQFHLC